MNKPTLEELVPIIGDLFIRGFQKVVEDEQQYNNYKHSYADTFPDFVLYLKRPNEFGSRFSFVIMSESNGILHNSYSPYQIFSAAVDFDYRLYFSDTNSVKGQYDTTKTLKELEKKLEQYLTIHWFEIIPEKRRKEVLKITQNLNDME